MIQVCAVHGTDCVMGMHLFVNGEWEGIGVQD